MLCGNIHHTDSLHFRSLGHWIPQSLIQSFVQETTATVHSIGSEKVPQPYSHSLKTLRDLELICILPSLNFH